MSHQTKYEKLLKIALRSNGVFSVVSGLAFILFSDSLSEFMGLKTPFGDAGATALIIIGGSVLLFAVGLFINAAREKVNLTEARVTVLLDAGWVIGSAIILFSDLVPLTTGGWWLIALIADVVVILAVWQFYALRKISSVDTTGMELRREAT